jgi:hypothetical protein
MPYIPSIICAAVLFAICYFLSVATLTVMQLFIAIAVAIVVYSATIFCYIRATL